VTSALVSNARDFGTAKEDAPMSTERRYWFPAKRYGWGWGPPSSWQGWLVMAAFLALVIAGVVVFRPDRQPGLFFVYLLVLCALLTGVCWLTGEPARWRWGGDGGE
jgi:hypothetical protein